MTKVLVTDTYLEDIADSIRAKNGSSDTYTPSQMSTAIDNLPSGGGSIQSLDDFKGAIQSWNNYLEGLPDTYPAYTNDSVTLYTPNANCKKYAILKLSTGKYKIIWSIDYLMSYSSNILGGYNSSRFLFQIKTKNGVILSDNVALERGGETATNSMYYSADYTTFEECLQAIQSNATTYTSSQGAQYTININGDYAFPCTNAVVFSWPSTYVVTGPVAERRISKNETISVIS